MAKDKKIKLAQARAKAQKQKIEILKLKAHGKTPEPADAELRAILDKFRQGKFEKIKGSDLEKLDDAFGISFIEGFHGWGHLSPSGISELAENWKDEIFEKIAYVEPKYLTEIEIKEAEGRKKKQQTDKETKERIENEIYLAYKKEYGEYPTRFVKFEQETFGGFDFEISPFSEYEAGEYLFQPDYDVNDKSHTTILKRLRELSHKDKELNQKSAQIAQRDVKYLVEEIRHQKLSKNGKTKSGKPENVKQEKKVTFEEFLAPHYELKPAFDEQLAKKIKEAFGNAEKWKKLEQEEADIYGGVLDDKQLIYEFIQTGNIPLRKSISLEKRNELYSQWAERFEEKKSAGGELTQTFIFQGMHHPQNIITVKTDERGTVQEIINPNNLKFPFPVGSRLGENTLIWATIRKYLINDENPVHKHISFVSAAQPTHMDEGGYFHGSKFNFCDTGFTLSKIGGGQGQNIYGQGIYLTPDKSLAKYYAKYIASPDENKAIEKKIAEKYGFKTYDEIPHDHDFKDYKSKFGKHEKYDLYDYELKKIAEAQKERGIVYETTLFKGKDKSQYNILDFSGTEKKDWEKAKEQIKALRKTLEANRAKYTSNMKKAVESFGYEFDQKSYNEDGWGVALDALKRVDTEEGFNSYLGSEDKNMNFALFNIAYYVKKPFEMDLWRYAVDYSKKKLPDDERHERYKQAGLVGGKLLTDYFKDAGFDAVIYSQEFDLTPMKKEDEHWAKAIVVFNPEDITIEKCAVEGGEKVIKPADTDKERKLKIAKAKAKAQKQKIEILKLAKEKRVVTKEVISDFKQRMKEALKAEGKVNLGIGSKQYRLAKEGSIYALYPEKEEEEKPYEAGETALTRTMERMMKGTQYETEAVKKTTKIEPMLDFIAENMVKAEQGEPVSLAVGGTVVSYGAVPNPIITMMPYMKTGGGLRVISQAGSLYKIADGQGNVIETGLPEEELAPVVSAMRNGGETKADEGIVYDVMYKEGDEYKTFKTYADIKEAVEKQKELKAKKYKDVQIQYSLS